jgi:hypothetical protein
MATSVKSEVLERALTLENEWLRSDVRGSAQIRTLFLTIFTVIGNEDGATLNEIDTEIVNWNLDMVRRIIHPSAT